MNHNHRHRGIYEITWDKFGSMCKELALEINKEFHPDCIIGISKGGLPFAVVLASFFRVDLYPIRLSYREKDRTIHSTPRWSFAVTEKVKDKNILLVDDIRISGKTLSMAREEILKLGATEVKTTTLSIHSRSIKPDFYTLDTDVLIIHPWDKWVLKNGKFTPHPEYKQR